VSFEMECSRFDELIEGYLDGEFGSDEARAIESHAAICSACAEELSLARKVSEGLAELTPLSCPDGVTARVRGALSALAEQADSEAAQQRAWRRKILQVAAALTLVAAGVILALSQRQDGPAVDSAQRHDSYTSEELALATKQLEWALAYVGHVTQTSMQGVGGILLGKSGIPFVRTTARLRNAARSIPTSN
jgi:anti-sigma factor RsiW